jgi:predicted ATP-grasp superfamily ATP-dependent carboligase
MHGRRKGRNTRTIACVIGSMDLVRPLGLAGIRSAVVVEPGDAATYSRFTCDVIRLVDPAREPARLAERLLAYARTRPDPPVLYYGQDADLLFVSRQREQLREGFRFVIPARELVEDLVDKERFRELARRLELPVPKAIRLPASAGSSADVPLRFPLVVKPVAHGHGDWRAVARGAKALRVETADELRRIWPALARERLDVLLQELIPGPETRVESYHVYVDAQGEVAGEFTGRKLRTDPPEFGETTALEITAAGDVAELGREVTRRLGLRGVAKLDFKRGADGRLHLLEVNPRFNLWHHAGAKAGVNLPALVYADLVGLARPPFTPARAGVRWIYHGHDARAARRQGLPLRRWLPWAIGADAKSVAARDDPLPMIMGGLARLGAVVGVGPRARRS